MIKARPFVLVPLIAYVAFGQTPTITAVNNSAVAAASPANKLCPGVQANIIGTNFGTSKSISVTVGGKQAAVISVQNTFMTVEIPVDAPTGATTVVVGSSAPFNITLVALAPGLFAVTGNIAQAFHQDQTPVDQNHPALAGETVIFTGTGLGPTTPVVPTGTPAPTAPASVNANVTATVGGRNAQVIFAGLAAGGVGINVIAIQMPASGLATGPQPVQIGVALGTGPAVLSNPVPVNYQAPPALTLVNNYSNVLPGLPNYGIAQGAIFDIYGAGLASTSTPLQNPPLQTTLSGVSITVTVNGTTVHPFIYFISPTQIAAILPSNTPVGDGRISVTSNGATIGPSPIHVVQSGFGVLTLSGLGVGMAAMYDASFNLVGLTNALHPGEPVNLFGSGIGPSPDSDQNQISAPTNLVGTLNPTVFVGGKQAQVTYAGRTIYPGLDQVQVLIPSDVSPGCFVGVVVKTGNIVSNYATIPVATTGRTCSEPTLGIPAIALQLISTKSSFTVGDIALSKDNYLNPNAPASLFTDSIDANFLKITPAAFSAADLQNPSVGSCTIYNWSGQDKGSPGNPGNGIAVLPVNAGPALNVTGPNGKMTVPYQNFQYKAVIGGTPDSGPTLPAFIPGSGGSFSVDNGANGGPDVGPLSATTQASQAPMWSNRGSTTTVNRANPSTLTWTGGLPEYTATIAGTSGTIGPTGVVGATFTCTVASTDGQFTPPADLMAAMPAGQGGLSVLFNQNPQTFVATGLDFGFLRLSYEMDQTVTYQ